MQHTTSVKQLFGILLTIVISGMIGSGCNDSTRHVILAPTLSVEIKPLLGVPQGDINTNIDLGVWVYNTAGDSLPGYSFSVWVTPDSIATVTPPRTTWMLGDLAQPNGVTTDHHITVIGKKYGEAIVHCSARDANNVVGEGTMKFTVKNDQGR